MKLIYCGTTYKRNPDNDKYVEVEILNWDDYLKLIDEAISDANSAEKKTQIKYTKVQALAVA